MTRSPFRRATPPSRRIATMERTKCWFSPIRPVTPCITIPSRLVLIPWPPRSRLEGGQNQIDDVPPAERMRFVRVEVAAEDGRKRVDVRKVEVGERRDGDPRLHR